jgi:hypothetical protein
MRAHGATFPPKHGAGVPCCIEIMLPGYQASRCIELYAIPAASDFVHGLVRLDETAAQHSQPHRKATVVRVLR